nr:reverse transcriptase domain-containing protein [Tanacetum cinerariifolium]
NPIMVKKHDGSWRMCVDFTDLNKACPQDCYPLPEIDWKVESLCGYPFKCFLDAYKGYHQIQLAAADEEKTAFHTGQGVYCYTKMPFGLKNAGATYQRLMDKAFKSQMGRNIEVYVDDLVVKSHTEAEIVRDIEETFQTLRKINMKLNPKKCSFGLAEGVFLGSRDSRRTMDAVHRRLVMCRWVRRRAHIDKPRRGRVHLRVEVLVEVLETKSITGKEVKAVIEEEGPTWMTKLVNYLKEGILPGDENEARKLRLKARQYELIEGILYKRSFLTPWLRCVGPLQAEYVMKEIHEGSCSMHAGPRPLSGRARESQVPDSRNGLLHKVDRSKGGGNDYRRIEEHRELTAMSEARSKSKMMKYYNSRVHGVAFKPGDFIYRSNDAS